MKLLAYLTMAVLLITCVLLFIPQGKGVQHPCYEDEGCSQEAAEYYLIIREKIFQ
jgi:hypothetical protein